MSAWQVNLAPGPQDREHIARWRLEMEAMWFWKLHHSAVQYPALDDRQRGGSRWDREGDDTYLSSTRAARSIQGLQDQHQSWHLGPGLHHVYPDVPQATLWRWAEAGTNQWKVSPSRFSCILRWLHLFVESHVASRSRWSPNRATNLWSNFETLRKYKGCCTQNWVQVCSSGVAESISKLVEATKCWQGYSTGEFRW